MNRNIAMALFLTVLFTGCISTPRQTFLPREKKGSVHTIGVVFCGRAELSMDAYKKDEQAEAASSIIGGAGQGLNTAHVLRDPLLTFLALPLVPIGAVIGGISAAANAMPAKRAEEIAEAVLPALSDFPLQQRIVEQIMAAGKRNTDYNFVDLHSGGALDQFEELDAILEIRVMSVGLAKAENALLLCAVVSAQLIQKNTGTSLSAQSFFHGWQAFGRKKPEAGDKPLMTGEVEGYINVLSEDIVDRLFLLDSFSAEFPVLGWEDSALLPGYPKPNRGFFATEYGPVTVDSLQPRLEWIPFPSKHDREEDKKGILNEIEHVSYDLRIWRMAEEEFTPVELVYERKGLVDPRHIVEQPLERGKRYYWAVRARFLLDGQLTVTRWALRDLTGFMPFKDSTLTKIAGLYRFSTLLTENVNQ